MGSPATEFLPADIGDNAPATDDDPSRAMIDKFWSDAKSALKGIPPLAWLLFAGIASIDTIGPFLGRRSRSSPEELFLLYFISQIGLIGVWAGLSSLSGLVRFPLAVAAVGLIVVVGFGAPRGADSAWFIWFVVFGSAAAVVAGVLLVVRLIGFRLVRIDETAGASAAANLPPRFQFSMLQAFLATTVFALFCGFVRFLYGLSPPGWPQFGPTIVEIVLIEGAMIGVPAVLASWIAFGRRWAWLRLTIGYVLTFGTIWLITSFGGGRPDEAYFRYAVFGFLLVGQLVVFRVCGFRFEYCRRRRIAPARSRPAGVS